MFKAHARRRDSTPPTAGGVAVADADRAIAEADRLQSEGDLLGAIDVLIRAGREKRDRRIERRLVRVRHRAFKTLPPPDAAPADATVVPPDLFPDVYDRPPEVPARSSTARSCGARSCTTAACWSGTCSTRSACTPRGRASTGASKRSRSARAGGRDRWYDPLDPPGRKLEKLRTWVQAYGGCLWMGDSPPMLFEVLDAYEQAGVLSAVTEYLGERPALSLEKSTLRRMPHTSDSSTWHQDGAFIGPERGPSTCGWPSTTAAPARRRPAWT